MEAVATGSVGPDQEVTVGVVAERLGIDPSAASHLVAETIGEGYLARLPSPTDRRRLRLELTDARRTLVAYAHQYQRTVFEDLTRDWTEAEQQEFARLLVKFVASVTKCPGSSLSLMNAQWRNLLLSHFLSARGSQEKGSERILP